MLVPAVNLEKTSLSSGMEQELVESKKKKKFESTWQIFEFTHTLMITVTQMQTWSGFSKAGKYEDLCGLNFSFCCSTTLSELTTDLILL